MAIPFDGHLRKFQFSKYILPLEYEYVTYRYTHLDNESKTLDHFLLFEHKATKQRMLLIALHEFERTDFSKASTLETQVRDPERRGIFHVKPGIDVYNPYTYLDIIRFLPMFLTKKNVTEGRDLILKGMQVTERKEIETEKIEVLLLKGSFQRLGFFKKSPSWFFKYPATVFDFLKPMHGALAIINDKATGKTIFTVGAQELGEPFNEEDFLYVVKSLTFDAEPVKEFVDRLRDRGVEASTTPGKLKIEFGK